MDKLEAALAAGREFIAKADAKHRLRDILVEEVSLVDRAANQHRFLMLKSEDGKTTDKGAR